MTGEFAALAAALLWALASILFADAGRYVKAINLNIVKGSVGAAVMVIALLTGTLFGAQTLNFSSLLSLSENDLLLLCLSGLIGIGAGDTAYFACLRRIGPQKGLMLESSAPIMAALLALLLYNEYLSSPAWLGICVTTLGVVMVVRNTAAPFAYRTTLAGVGFGILAAFCQATGIVISRKVLLSGNVEPLTSGLVRLAAALVLLVIWINVRARFTRRSASYQSFRLGCRLIIQHKLTLKLLLAISLGTFLAIWLMQLSVRHTSAGVTQTLLATCPLFGMVYGCLQGQKQPFSVWIGLFAGITGVVFLFLR
jgi:drug/metabolite transporter (DMT)-like permease